MTETFYVTTPIYYVNAEPHLGHLYTTMYADTLRRYNRQRGREVYFLTGTDEHSQKIERAAEAAGKPVGEFVDGLAARFQEIFSHWGLGYDQFIRTTSDYHKAGAQELWRRCDAAGFIYKGEYAGWYCHKDNAFVEGPDDPTAPPPHCPECGRLVEWLAEESYFFKLSEFQKPLLDYYAAHPDFIEPEARRQEIVAFGEGGLKDLAISRATTTWGVPVPSDPTHVMYVWFEALSNYVTALGFGNDHGDLWRFWPAVHVIGKDIMRFHAVYWPAFLMAAGVELPRTVLIHGMWLSGGRRMSKTEGNGVDIGLLDRHFSHDAVRYYCLSEMPYAQDGDFTYAALVDRANADLANGLGNLASRTLTMLERYFEGVVPESPGDQPVRSVVEGATELAIATFEGYDFRRGIEAIRHAMSVVDKYISDTKPWALAKDAAKREELATVLVTALEALRFFTVLLAPVLPEGAPKIWAQLGLAGDPGAIDPHALAWGATPAGHRIGAIEPVFPRLNKEAVMAEIEKETHAAPAQTGAEAPTAAPTAAPTGEHETQAEPLVEEPDYITIDDFLKVELKVGEVLEAGRIEGADKLLKLRVDVGEAEPRQILAGIAEHFAPEALVGRKIVVVANLKPRKMRGLESQGMLLAASLGEEGKPVLATFADEVPNGARLK
jgi:methionyl-tRNA synthetase